MINLHLSRRIQHAITGLILLLLSYIIPSYPLGFILLMAATITFYYIHYKRIYDIEWDNWYITKFGTLLREHELGEWEGENDNDDNGNTDEDSASLSKSKHITNKDTTTTKYKKRRSRRKTIPSLPGAFYFLLGTTMSTYTFSISIARTSLLVLSLADPIAGIVGVICRNIGLNISWKMLFRMILRGNGERGGGGPTVAGSVACGITTILCTYVYIPSYVDNQSTISSSSNNDNSSISLSFNARLWIGIITAITEAISGRYLPVIGIRIADDNLWIPLVVGSLILLLNED